MSARVPTGLDSRLLQIYLTDHLAGATALLQRLKQMRKSYSDLPIHDDITRITAKIHAERRQLKGIIKGLGLSRRRHQELLAKLGELLGRLKLNGRLVSRSPLTPLLELELLRSGVIGKLSLWQTLGLLADDLGLDRAEFATLEQQALDQLEDIARAHQTMVGPAFKGHGEA